MEIGWQLTYCAPGSYHIRNHITARDLSSEIHVVTWGIALICVKVSLLRILRRRVDEIVEAVLKLLRRRDETFKNPHAKFLGMPRF
jgi:hypothetical protein